MESPQSEVDRWKRCAAGKQPWNMTNSILSGIWVEEKMSGFFCLDNVADTGADFRLLRKATIACWMIWIS